MTLLLRNSRARSHWLRLPGRSRTLIYTLNMSLTPRIISKSELSSQDAKWITLQKIKYSDAEGKERFWECAERKTRKSTGVDAVAIMALIKSKTNAFPISTVIIEQFRPPIGRYIIGMFVRISFYPLTNMPTKNFLRVGGCIILALV
ncbi:hypothetical protein Ac2012v2_001580 [Leucoagaricus gongylophorus]